MNIPFLLLLLLVPLSQDHSHAGEVLDRTVTERVTPAGGPIIAIDVNGMVCDFCAIAIDKVFRREKAVADIAVNLSDKLVVVALKEGGAMSDARLKKLVNDSGYALVRIRRG